MAGNLTAASALRRLQDPAPLGEDAFSLLRYIGQALAVESAATRGVDASLVELAIRLLDRREELAGYEGVLNAVLRAVGLFPYVAPESLTVSDQLAFEAHRPLGMEDLVLHRIQGELYRRALSGENLLLSAPTSFGKSLIVDALLASARYDNIVVLVPTLALIDEVRRRLTRFSSRYKIVTHPSQSAGERNVYVMTQERLLDLNNLPELDLFIIDEFYKLDARRDNERASLLNSAFDRLRRTGAQFLLLGPNIEGVTAEVPGDFRATFFHTDFKTVAANVRQLTATRANEQELLLDTLAGLSGSTLLYCRSPNRARQISEWLMEQSQEFEPPHYITSAVTWLSSNYDPDWYVVRALRAGIGVHHGRLPRSLAQWMVRAFNEGHLKVLMCTSTLIEGVNTRAKNVLVFDRTIARQAYDFFTFNNIRGRSGRMFQHFVGNVILFHPPPDPTLPVVDIPALSQSEGADDALLLQLPEANLSDRSRSRLQPYFDQDLLSIDLLRENHGVDPAAQITVADRIRNDPQLAESLQWSGYPRYGELRTAGELILQLKGQRGMAAGVSSGNQLAYRMSRLSRSEGDVQTLISDAKSDLTVDEAIEEALEFTRYWAGHNFPRYLMALDAIQREVLPRMELEPGNYSFYAGRVENLFTDPPLQALEEYGIPLQISRKLTDWLQPNGDLDALLERLKSLDLGTLALDDFERDLLEDALNYSG